jgi:magnesium chelatase family protein
MLARRLTTILPAMRLAEALETTRIHRVAGLTGAQTAVVTTRPFRAPHHTISDVGLIGGGHIPMPGEVSLAHNGVLFLDELPEFRRHVLEVLRQPPSRRVSCTYNFAGVLNPNTFAEIALRVMAMKHSGGGR